MKKLKLLKSKSTWDAQVRKLQQIVTRAMHAKVLREWWGEWLSVSLWIRAYCLQPSEDRQEEFYRADLEKWDWALQEYLYSLQLFQASGMLAPWNIILIKTFTLRDRINLMKGYKDLSKGREY